jgi:phosphoglucosamine mutase
MAWHPFRNVGLKVVALVLGGLLWFTVSGQQAERPVADVPVVFVNKPDGLELTEQTSLVDIHVRGLDSQLRTIQARDFEARVDLKGARLGTQQIPLRTDQVNAPFGVEVTQVQPGAVMALLEVAGAASMSVVADIDGTPKQGFVVSETTVEPATVTVLGPQRRISPTEHGDEQIACRLTARHLPVTASVKVGVADAALRLREPTTARVVVKIEPAGERTFAAARVSVRNLAQGLRAHVEPGVVSVVLRGGQSVLGRLGPDAAEPYVDVTGLGPGRHEVPGVPRSSRAGSPRRRGPPLSPSSSTDRNRNACRHDCSERTECAVWPGVAAGSANGGAPRRRGRAGRREAGAHHHRARYARVGRMDRAGVCARRGVCRRLGHQRGRAANAGRGVSWRARWTSTSGVVLSASHNPYSDNGIKVFSGRGEKFGEASERAVERVMADTSWNVDGAPEAAIASGEFVEPYLEYLRRLLPSAGALAGARIGVDMANGATATTAVPLFGRLGFDVVAVGNAPDGRNINLECGSTHPARLAGRVVSDKCRMGVAFDGDGDRAIFVDHLGHVVDGDAVLLMLGLHLKRQGKLPGDTVVATVMSNIGLEIAFRNNGVRMLRTPVGDKYVMEEMLNGGYALGGEQSGHVIQAEHLPTGDGMATALAVLRVMAQTGRELADLASELKTFPQTLVNVRVKQKRPVEEVPDVQRAIERVESALQGRGPRAGAVLRDRAAASHHDRRRGPGDGAGLGGRNRRRGADGVGVKSNSPCRRVGHVDRTRAWWTGFAGHAEREEHRDDQSLSQRE